MSKWFGGTCRSVFILVVAASLVVTMGSLVQAKDKKLMEKGFQMMLTSFAHMDNGVKTIDKGVAMVDQIAKEKGVEKDIAVARKTIDSGRAIGGDGFKVFRQGQKLYLENKGKFNEPMFKGVDLMIKGADTIGKAVNNIKEGMVAVNKVAEEKKFTDLMEPPNKTVKTGVEMALRGVKSFAEGKKLYMENK
jgi:hypothetical protein